MVWNDLPNLQGEARNSSSNNVYHTALKLSYLFLSFPLTVSCLSVDAELLCVLLAPISVSGTYRGVSKPWLNKAVDGNH